MNRFYLKSFGYAFFATQILLCNILKQLNGTYSLLHLWTSICFAALLLLWQILTIKEENTKSYIILFEIIFLSFMLHLMFVPTDGLFDSDPQFEFNLIRTIQQYGWSINLDSEIYMPIGGFSYWPILSFLIIGFSNVTGISLLNSARYVPSLSSIITLFFIFLITNMLYRNKRVALLATFLFSTSYIYFWNNSMLTKTSYAFVLFSITIYLYLTSIMKKSNNFRFLSVIILVTMVLSHHFTSLISIIFLIVFTVTITISKRLPTYFQKFIEVKTYVLNRNFIVLTFSGIIGYWIYLAISPLSTLVFSVKNFLDTGIFLTLNPPWGNLLKAESDLRILLWVNSLRVIFVLTLLLLLYTFIFKRIRKMKGMEVGMLMFTGLMFIMYYLMQYGHIIRMIYADRFQIFAWLVLLPILSSILIYLYRKQGSLKGKLFCIGFILIYLTMNFTALQPYYYDNSSDIPFESGFSRQSFKPEWYSISDFFDHFLSNQTTYIGRRLPGVVQTDRGVSDILSQNFPGMYRTNPLIFKEGDPEELKKSNTDWIIIHREMFRLIKPALLDRATLRNEQLSLTHIAIENIRSNALISYIYSNGLFEIYSVRHDE